MRIAVIGGTGVVGHHTVEALRRAGHDATVPPLLVQPVATSDVADVLAEIALGTHRAGPPILVDRSRKIWSTWLGARCRCGVSRSD